MPDAKKNGGSNKAEFDNAQRAAVLMRKMEYAMGLTKKTKNIFKKLSEYKDGGKIN